MGLWQHLVRCYEENADALSKDYPLSSTTISNNSDDIIIVVIDGDGNFRGHEIIPKRPTGEKRGLVPLAKITIPASENSLKRTSTANLPYPVFEQFDYMEGLIGYAGWGKDYVIKFRKHCESVDAYVARLKHAQGANQNENIVLQKRRKKWGNYKKTVQKLERYEKKQEAYIEQLKAFSESQYATVQVKAIYKYISGRTIACDLLNLEPKPKTWILFQVEISEVPEAKTWQNGSVFTAWHKYYWSKKCKEGDEELYLDYLTGRMQPKATFHPKKISNGSANAKLVSKPADTSFITYQGKFVDAEQALSIGYESSQKAHQYLRYLIDDRGFYCGEQVIVSFTVGGANELPPPPIEEKSIWDLAQSLPVITDRDRQIQLSANTGFDYADSLRKSIAGYGLSASQKEHDKAVVLALDAATTGRLSITFYRELARGEYLERIADWHDHCKWHQSFKDSQNDKVVHFLGAPSVDRIIQAVYGKSRGAKDESYAKIKKKARERLLRCIFDGANIPVDYVRSSLIRASTPLAVTRNGKFNRYDFMTLLSTACALIRKDYQERQTTKEGYEMSIELDRTDRDYLYGRLLGAADKLEEYALYKKGNARMVTAAIRHMQAFAQRPFRTWTTIHGCLNPYIQQVKGSFGIREIEGIMPKFEKGDYEKDMPLGGAYLLGYYHERSHIEKLVNEHSKNN